MPMPQANDNTGGGLLGALRTLMLADANLASWFGDNVKAYALPPAGDATAFPFGSWSFVSENGDLDSQGYNWNNVVVQLSVWGVGAWPTEYVRDYLWDWLPRQQVLVNKRQIVYLFPLTRTLLRDKERSSATSGDVYHAALRFRVTLLSQAVLTPR